MRLLIFLLVFPSHLVFAQSNNWGMAASASLGTSGNRPFLQHGIAANLAGYIEYQHNMVGVSRTVGTAVGELDESFSETAIFYGRSFSTRWLRITGSAGISFIKGEWEDFEEDFHHYTTNALSLEGCFLFKPLNFIGLGLKAQHTFSRRSFEPALLLTLQAGLM